MSSVNLASSLPVEVRVILIVAFGKRNRVFSQHFGFSITPLSPYTKYVCPLNVQVLVLIAGFSALMGTYVERKMEQFLKSPKTKKTVINGLVLFEQRVNLLNVPLILMQLLWILASDS